MFLIRFQHTLCHKHNYHFTYRDEVPKWSFLCRLLVNDQIRDTYEIYEFSGKRI